MGGIGGAKLLELLVGPLRYPVGSLFCESKIFSRELFKDFEERKDNNLLQDIFENFSDDSLVDIKDIEWLKERATSTFDGNIIKSLLGLDLSRILRNFISKNKYK